VEQDVKGTVSFQITAIYVDDFIPTSKTDEVLNLIKQELMANYYMTYLGDLSWCLRIHGMIKSRTKHIKIRYHFNREMIAAG